MEIKELARLYKQYVINMRREFHKNPEASLKEFWTSGRIKGELDVMGIPWVSCAGTGIIATIEGMHEGKTIGLRADMDALEITEANEVEYKSQNDGIMHACGHDGHIAMLLGTAKILNECRDKIKGTVKLFFQPAEEIARGAKMMIDEGALNGVDGVFAIHLWSGLDVGKVSVEAGPRMAAADFFKIIIKGKSGHGSMPHQAIDAVVAGAACVMNLQSLVSREMNPLESVVISVGSFHSGTRNNIIANEALLEGTARCFNPKIRQEIPDVLERMVKNTAAGYRAEAELRYVEGTAPTINNVECSKLAASCVEKILSRDAVAETEKTTGGEDFSLFLEKAPGIIAFVGIRNEEKGTCYAHHHENFNMDEDALEIGTALYAQYAVDFLNSK
ncbi:putative hydrolase YxeP [Oxobacter pfennigii]|uniref:Putative hydrolase YxeP n=1 Tax=Oxobacter pfennigii TaxID=36849 RepID=A0A0P8WST1_9CLOT|nr:M20 family metallopeptidase [Oxobacter pfennigii]KPU45667.1 putative hydrolase YxeP [Oxobacter pfennigii]